MESARNVAVAGELQELQGNVWLRHNPSLGTESNVLWRKYFSPCVAPIICGGVLTFRTQIPKHFLCLAGNI